VRAVNGHLWLVLALALGMSGRAEEGKVKKGDLKRAIATGNLDLADEAIGELVKAGGAASIKTILGLLDEVPPTEDGIYWSLISGAVSFVDRAAMDELGKFVAKHKSGPLGRDLLYGLVKNMSPYVAEAFGDLLTEGPAEVRRLVATKISRVRSHAAVDALIRLLRAEEKGARDGKPSELAWIAVDGLSAITGQKFGPNSINWDGWWQKNKDQPLSGSSEGHGDSSSGTAVDFVRADPERREAFVGLEKAPKKGVLVITAEFTKKTQRDLNNDRMEKVLEQMGVPHTVVRREDFLGFDLKGVGAILVNCAQFNEFCICPDCKPSGGQRNRLRVCSGCNKHVNFSGQLGAAEVEKIKKFVMQGGFLFCEDWTAKEVVDKAFPKWVGVGGKLWTDEQNEPREANAGEAKDKVVKLKLKDGTVDVSPARGMGTHAYLKGVFVPKVIQAPPPELAAGPPKDAGGKDKDDADEEDEEDEEGTTIVVNIPRPEADAPEKGPPVRIKHTWTIDNESFYLKVADKARVLTILTSNAVSKATEGDGAVAVAFRPGAGPLPGARGAPKGSSGVVVAVLSHFGKQSSKEDELSIQNLLLNFLIEANIARTQRELGTGKASGAKKAKKKKPAAEDDEPAPGKETEKEERE
jgi:hypothetical protein